MTDYRNIATKNGILRNTKNQHYTASIGYSNALDLLFANVKASYWRANNNLTYAYSYDGALTYIESVNVPNLSHGLMLEAKVSKQILSIGTIFNIGGGWNRNMVFLGAKLTYKAKKFYYTLDARNLLNTRSFGSVITSDITDYRYSYALRPMGIILTVRCNF